MAKHIHADLWTKYAEFAQIMENPWSQFQYWNYEDECWCDLDEDDGLWARGTAKYRLKPRTIKIGNIDVPEPVREPLENGMKYFVVATSGFFLAEAGIWNGAKIHMIHLERGLIHLDPESAELHAKALISLTSK
ncbi:hypothetical protein [Xenorhabdus koppenhoeferi]|uniref:Uncharacterized protein n=1 Tax=Xenorhabdus koppenhoeferi TaxID=351659 RepID=A0A1I7K8M4_9GAMM|nr:hypothetical protein [Xenorhabdus koppenhoeferi]SFU93796.1 hypothetical protein SAMN05421784_14928 [Xenorhabdus koppenhoeferi]